MTARDEPVDSAPPANRAGMRVLRAAGLLLLLLVVAMLLLWSQRRTIAYDYIARTLAKKHVAARYRITDLGFNRQRLTHVVIGDPRRPDLVADWIELNTSVGLSGATVTAVRAGHVRMRARLAGGKVSFGQIDRLLPPPSGEPFTLPSFIADIADARVRLETPQGIVGLKISGRGRLDDGFSGQLAAMAPQLALGSCTGSGVQAALKLHIRDRRPTITGPVRAAGVACGGTWIDAPGADLAVDLNEALDRWNGRATLSVARVDAPGTSVADGGGTVSFAGTAQDLAGDVDLKTKAARTSQGRAQALSLAGRYRLKNAAIAFDGRAGAAQAALAAAWRQRLAALPRSAAGSPVAPLAAQLAAALDAVARGSDLTADLRVRSNGATGMLQLARLSLSSASGARVGLNGGQGVRFGWPRGAPLLDGTLTTGGGGLPEARIALRRAGPGQPISGEWVVQPYAAGGASLSLAPVRFTATPGRNTHIVTRAELSGPLGDGRVEALALPIDALWNGGDRFVLNPDCSDLSFARLETAGLRLDPAHLRLCPVDGALLRLTGASIGGGATIAAPRLTGALGGTPLTLATDRAALRLAGNRFELGKLAVRLGAAGRVTRLDAGRLEGALSGGAIHGRFAESGGQIANVPLVLSAAAGDWRVQNGALKVTGALTVADEAATPRFKPLAARGVALSLANGEIVATGALFEPTKSFKVADVAIRHTLASGAGAADLTVRGITFTKDAQPDLLTPLTFGVIADVDGTVSGEGHIRWNAQAVTSDGVFRTANTNLAAAFGPVTGIGTEIRFTDLLGLQSAPGQIATVKEINPGVPVDEGVVRFQTLPNARIQVEGAQWPFAGGTLTMEPTLLDFSEARERRMTFTIAGMNAAQFLQQFDFKNLDATGTFDGSLPMVFDAEGGKIVGGRLKARAGGGGLAYVGGLTEKDLGFWGNMAFQALKSLKYRDLDIVMNGPLSGEIITEVRFAGLAQGAGAKRNFILDRLQKLPFVFNVKIKAPFRQLIDSAQSFYDPKRLIERNLPTLLEEQNKRTAPPPQPKPVPTRPIQPPASGTVP